MGYVTNRIVSDIPDILKMSRCAGVSIYSAVLCLIGSGFSCSSPLSNETDALFYFDAARITVSVKAVNLCQLNFGLLAFDLRLS